MKIRRRFVVLYIFFMIPVSGIAEQPDCTIAGCHSNLTDQRVIHPPLEDGCEYCHTQSEEQHPDNTGNEFSLVEPIPGLCEACHEDMGSMNVVHAPVEEGECLDCHSVHSSPNLFLLNAWPVEKVCESCHDAEMWQDDVQHKPIKDGNCQSCHDPHQSEFASLVRFQSPKLCIQCHPKEEKQQSLENLHPPFEQDCVSCHLPHSAKEKKMLVEKIPDLCFTCHDDIQTAIQENRFVHIPVDSGSFCLNCHLPHASNISALLKKDGRDLCFSCHGNATSRMTGKGRGKSIREKILNSTVVHEPVSSDGCSACHNPHTSNNNFLLSAPFPKGNYTLGKVDSFGLCFECHDSDLLEEPAATTATNFRDGEKNLHNLHISDDKARSCINCHDVHGANTEHLIADDVFFGKWKMPLKYKISENGGSCLPGCHTEKSYKR